MTAKPAFYKSTSILAIIIEELGIPANATFGDIMFYLSFFDDNDEIRKMLSTAMRDEVIAEIKRKLRGRKEEA